MSLVVKGSALPLHYKQIDEFIVEFSTGMRLPHRKWRVLKLSPKVVKNPWIMCCDSIRLTLFFFPSISYGYSVDPRMAPGNKVSAKFNKIAAVNSALATQLLGTEIGSECTSSGSNISYTTEPLWQRKFRLINYRFCCWAWVSSHHGNLEVCLTITLFSSIWPKECWWARKVGSPHPYWKQNRIDLLFCSRIK